MGCCGGGFGRGSSGVDCGDDGEVVLVLVEVGAGCGVSFVEGVEEGWVEGTEGEFVDYVGKVECYTPRQHRRQMQHISNEGNCDECLDKIQD